jgi:hypothetical protein
VLVLALWVLLVTHLFLTDNVFSCIYRCNTIFLFKDKDKGFSILLKPLISFNLYLLYEEWEFCKMPCSQHVWYEPYLANLPYPAQVLWAANTCALLDSHYQDAGGVAYMVPATSSTNPSSLDGDGHPNLSHTTRVSPATVSPLLSQSCSLHISVSYTNNTLYLMLFKGMAARKGVCTFYLHMFFHKSFSHFLICKLKV